MYTHSGPGYYIDYTLVKIYTHSGPGYYIHTHKDIYPLRTWVLHTHS